MQIGEVIREHRKAKNLTQEEMARRLGVTAPAVNKWEKGHSLPDVALLSPIARLLGISVDTLLCHQEEISDAEAVQLVEQTRERLQAEGIDAVYPWIRQCLLEHPASHALLLGMANLLVNHLSMTEAADRARYDADILDWTRRALESPDEAIRRDAAQSLYHFYLNKKQYVQAEETLAHFSPENPERKRMQAAIYSETGRQDEAYLLYEELLYAGYASLSRTFQDLYWLARHANDLGKAHALVEKQRELARLFEMGEYHEASAGLDLATWEKDEAETLRIMERMLGNLESIGGFAKSPLYAHMKFKAMDAGYLAEVRQVLLEGFRDESSYGYLKDNLRWRELLGVTTHSEA
ncbi:MAG: helix-turn-helix domain-containing protein [Oscillospiraceae bacterium]|jgi:transcriptional regulator with XRE-family HTH domain|nr:helix-turn-helix domain-containing protein [Oscillospiraceae bacterium]